MIFTYFSDKGCTDIAKIQQTAIIDLIVESKNSKHSGKPTVFNVNNECTCTFLKTMQANINKMKLHTGTCLTTNIHLVLESALVTEIAWNTFSNQLSVQEMKFIIDTFSDVIGAWTVTHNVLVGLPVPT